MAKTVCGWCNQNIKDWHKHINQKCPNRAYYFRYVCNSDRQNLYLKTKKKCKSCEFRYTCYTQLDWGGERRL